MGSYWSSVSVKFIRVKQEQASEKLEKTTIATHFGDISAELVTPDHFWTGLTTFSYQNWSRRTFVHPKSVRPDCFTRTIFLWQAEHNNQPEAIDSCLKA